MLIKLSHFFLPNIEIKYIVVNARGVTYYFESIDYNSTRHKCMITGDERLERRQNLTNPLSIYKKFSIFLVISSFWLWNPTEYELWFMQPDPTEIDELSFGLGFKKSSSPLISNSRHIKCRLQVHLKLNIFNFNDPSSDEMKKKNMEQYRQYVVYV